MLLLNIWSQQVKNGVEDLEGFDAEVVYVRCDCWESLVEFCVDYSCPEEETIVTEIQGVEGTVETVLILRGSIFRRYLPIVEGGVCSSSTRR
jgi:hypothetical protein